MKKRFIGGLLGLVAAVQLACGGATIPSSSPMEPVEETRRRPFVTRSTLSPEEQARQEYYFMSPSEKNKKVKVLERTVNDYLDPSGSSEKMRIKIEAYEYPNRRGHYDEFLEGEKCVEVTNLDNGEKLVIKNHGTIQIGGDRGVGGFSSENPVDIIYGGLWEHGREKTLPITHVSSDSEKRFGDKIIRSLADIIGYEYFTSKRRDGPSPLFKSYFTGKD
jgi:hypothetical protein